MISHIPSMAASFMESFLARVLIVDDDEDIRHNIADILDDLGYQTTSADDGFSALDRIRDRDFDIVLLDYKMPGMDGVELFQEIKKICPAIKAVMMTAWAGSDGAQLALDAGAREVLRKPVDIRELLEIISEPSPS